VAFERLKGNEARKLVRRKYHRWPHIQRLLTETCLGGRGASGVGEY